MWTFAVHTCEAWAHVFTTFVFTTVLWKTSILENGDLFLQVWQKIFYNRNSRGNKPLVCLTVFWKDQEAIGVTHLKRWKLGEHPVQPGPWDEFFFLPCKSVYIYLLVFRLVNVLHQINLFPESIFQLVLPSLELTNGWSLTQFISWAPAGGCLSLAQLAQTTAEWGSSPQYFVLTP